MSMVVKSAGQSMVRFTNALGVSDLTIVLGIHQTLGIKRKGKEMNVSVQNLDGTKIHPSYAPEHATEVKSFYSNLVATKKISGYVIRFANGDVMAEGMYL